MGVGLAAFAWLGLAPVAQAGAPECDGVHVERGAACEVVVSAGCEASCDVSSVLDRCAADLMASCQAGCDLDADITCVERDCTPQCEAQCQADGGQVICHEGCMREGRDACTDACEPGDDPCFAGCEATLSGECEQSCANVPVDADCFEACQECCHGSCSARINLDCQLGCQAGGFVDCQVAALDACEASCGLQGTLFCDGQYVVAGDQVGDCVDALADRGIRVDWDVDIDVQEVFEGLGDEARDSVGLCRVDPQGGRGAAFAVLGLLGLLVARRRRR